MMNQFNMWQMEATDEYESAVKLLRGGVEVHLRDLEYYDFYTKSQIDYLIALGAQL